MNDNLPPFALALKKRQVNESYSLKRKTSLLNSNENIDNNSYFIPDKNYFPMQQPPKNVFNKDENVEKLLAEINSLKFLNEQLTSDNEQLQRENLQLNDEKNRLRALLTENNKDLIVFKARYTEAEETISMLQKQIRDYEEIFHNRSAATDVNQTIVLNLQEENRRLTKQCRSASDLYTSQLSQLRQAQERISHLESEIISLHSSKNLNDDFSKPIGGWKSSYADPLQPSFPPPSSMNTVQFKEDPPLPLDPLIDNKINNAPFSKPDPFTKSDPFTKPDPFSNIPNLLPEEEVVVKKAALVDNIAFDVPEPVSNINTDLMTISEIKHTFEVLVKEKNSLERELNKVQSKVKNIHYKRDREEKEARFEQLSKDVAKLRLVLRQKGNI